MKPAAIAAVLLGVALAAVLVWLVAFGPDPMAELLAGIDDEALLDDAHHHIPHLEPSEWVEIFDPDRAWNGYTLVLYRRRVPMIIDMNGRIVHVWPRVRVLGRMRLDREGRLAVIGPDDLVKEYDWDGRLTWAYRMPDEDHLPHHDLIRLENGNYLVLGRIRTGRVDYLHEVDRRGRVVWEWTADEQVLAAVPGAELVADDLTHINSMNELGPNRWFDAGDERFRPGNILLSARNLNALLIVDRRTGEVVWSHHRGLDFQHEAIMVPRGQVGDGLIVVFDNGYHNRAAYRQSRIVALDPVTGAEVWSYEAPEFFSSVAGVQQPLPNGNVLITSSQGGRVFEVTLGGHIVWQWLPPFEPMRAARLVPDHCPQLAALPRAELTPVRWTDRPRWIDIELAQFTLPEEHVVREIHGERRQLVPKTRDCRELWLPQRPVLRFGHGLDPAAATAPGTSVRFSVTLAGADRDLVAQIYSDEMVAGEGEPWRDVKLQLPEWGEQRVTLCLHAEAEPPGGPVDGVLWENPAARSAVRAALHSRWRKTRMTEQEKDLAQRQLEAIGYVQ